MLLQKFVSKVRIVVAGSTSKPHHLLNLLPNSSFRFISSISNSGFTIDYLINSCGLSPESALKASKTLELKSPTKPDSVLSLLKSFHIPKPHISKLITNRPNLLLADPNKTLKPKLEFFNNLGISGPELGKLVSSHNNCLMSSLENRIIPFIDLLRSLVHTNSNVVKILCESKWLFEDTTVAIGPNIKLLQDNGVPQSSIEKFIIRRPEGLCVSPDLFNDVLLELQKMGVSCSSMTFLRCLHVLVGMRKPLWNAKLALYKSFGWSEYEVLSLFKKQPNCMAISVNKINSGMNFLMNKLNWTRDDVARNPTVLVLSLEKRVIPRSCVLQILLSKGLIKKSSVGQAFMLTEDRFLEKFIRKYHGQVPELLKVYQSKIMTTQDQGLLTGPEEDCKIDKI